MREQGVRWAKAGLLAVAILGVVALGVVFFLFIGMRWLIEFIQSWK